MPIFAGFSIAQPIEGFIESFSVDVGARLSSIKGFGFCFCPQHSRAVLAL